MTAINRKLKREQVDLEPNDTIARACSSTNATNFAVSLTTREKW